MSTPAPHGNRCICASCAAPFYDLNKVPAACPKCGHVVSLEKKTTGRRTRRTKDLTPLETSFSTPHKVIVTQPSSKLKGVKWK